MAEANMIQLVAADVPEVADAAPAAPGSIADAEYAAHHETVLGLDSYAIVGLAFLAFIAILWKAGAFRMIVKALDSESDRVRSELAEAQSLRAEAETLRESAAAEAAATAAQAKATIANAEAEAERIIARAHNEAEATIARQQALAEERIAAEVLAVESELRRRTADLALAAAGDLLRQRSDDLQPLVDEAIAGIVRLPQTAAEQLH